MMMIRIEYNYAVDVFILCRMLFIVSFYKHGPGVLYNIRLSNYHTAFLVASSPHLRDIFYYFLWNAPSSGLDSMIMIFFDFF